MKVVVTHHGPDYRREKWHTLAKMFLRFCEFIGMTFANEVIAITNNISDDIKRKFGRTAIVIPNGVEVPNLAETEDVLRKFGLKKERYILAVGRFVPEKGFDYLIDAFIQLQVSNHKPQIEDWKLVIVGNASYEDRYSMSLKEQAQKNNNIVLTGFLTGRPLQEIYSHAGLFVIPSYYEGLPIVLLEAMSYGLSCIASNISANKSVGLLSDDRLFKLGDVNALAAKIREFIDKPLTKEERRKMIDIIAEKYNWTKIADETLKVYKQIELAWKNWTVT
jgi:glycosyltransferase involved in cell wall biosynthesis